MQPLKTYYAQEIEIWMKSHPNTVVTHYQTARLVGKAYLKSATTAIAADEIRKTGLLPYNSHIFDEHDFLEESQRTITRCLLVSSVPCTNNSEQTSSTTGTNPQTLTNSHSACFTKRPCCCFAVKHWSCSRHLWQETRTVNKTRSIPKKDLLLLWRLTL
jgi:hypothetical protein